MAPAVPACFTFWSRDLVESSSSSVLLLDCTADAVTSMEVVSSGADDFSVSCSFVGVAASCSR